MTAVPSASRDPKDPADARAADDGWEGEQEPAADEAPSTASQSLVSAASSGTANAETMASWRRSVLDRVVVGVLVAEVVMTVVDLREAVVTEDYRFMPPMLIALLGTSVVAFAKRIPVHVRGAGLVLVVAAAVGWNLFDSAFYVPNTFVVAAVITLIVAVSVGRNAGWWTLGLFVAVLFAVATRFLTGESSPSSEMFDPSSLGNWFRVIVTFVLATGTGLLSVAFLTNKLEGAVNQSAKLLTALRRESESRVVALKKQQTLEAQLRQAEELEALGRLAGGVAHDFNNLLVVIINHAALLRNSTPPSAHEELQAIEHAGRRAAALTRQLLTYGRHHERDTGDLDVNQTLAASVSLVRRLLPSTVEFEFSPDPAAGTVRASRVDLEQLVLNLCINGRDAMPAGGRLVVSTHQGLSPADAPEARSTTPFVCIKVKDTGLGIDPAQRDKIFDPFFTTKGVGKGTGLGLNVVQRVVQAAGGVIEVDSGQEKGTEFSVYLPCSAAPSPGVSLEAAVPPSRGGRETIMVVDDLPEVCSMTAQLLRGAGYRTLTCANGDEACARYRAHRERVDLIVSDVVMPRMSGKELYEAIGAEQAGLPFVFCTGYSSDVLPEGYFDHPGRILLAKPFDAGQLLRAVRSLLDSHGGPPQPVRKMSSAMTA